MPEVEKPDLSHRRHAIQIIAQLPETQADALLILEAAKDFVLKFLAEDYLEAPPRQPGGRRLVPGAGLGFSSQLGGLEPLTHIDGPNIP